MSTSNKQTFKVVVSEIDNSFSFYCTPSEIAGLVKPQNAADESRETSSTEKHKKLNWKTKTHSNGLFYESAISRRKRKKKLETALKLQQKMLFYFHFPPGFVFCDKFCVFAGLDIPDYLLVSVRLPHVCLGRAGNKKTFEGSLFLLFARSVGWQKCGNLIVFLKCGGEAFSLSFCLGSDLVFQLVLSFNKN